MYLFSINHYKYTHFPEEITTSALTEPVAELLLMFDNTFVLKKKKKKRIGHTVQNYAKAKQGVTVY